METTEKMKESTHQWSVEFNIKYNGDSYHAIYFRGDLDLICMNEMDGTKKTFPGVSNRLVAKELFSSWIETIEDRKLEKLEAIYQEEYDLYCDEAARRRNFPIMSSREFVTRNYL